MTRCFISPWKRKLPFPEETEVCGCLALSQDIFLLFLSCFYPRPSVCPPPPSVILGDGSLRAASSRTLSPPFPLTSAKTSPCMTPRATFSRSPFVTCGPKVGPASLQHLLGPLQQLPQRLPGISLRQHRWCLTTLLQVLGSLPPTHRLLSHPGELAALAKAVVADSPQDDESDSLRLRRKPTPESLTRGLGPRGSASVPLKVWAHFNLPPRLPPHPPALCRPCTDAALLLHTIQTEGAIVITHLQPATTCFASYKSHTKARLMLFQGKLFKGLSLCHVLVF